jgi:hypothetical protein
LFEQNCPNGCDAHSGARVGALAHVAASKLDVPARVFAVTQYGFGFWHADVLQWRVWPTASTLPPHTFIVWASTQIACASPHALPSMTEHALDTTPKKRAANRRQRADMSRRQATRMPCERAERKQRVARRCEVVFSHDDRADHAIARV